MKAVEIKNIQASPNPHGIETKKFHENDHVQALHITLNPGEKLKKHITAVDVFFYVLEGKGIVEIGDEKKEIIKDTFIDSPAKIQHCWFNESNKILRVLVVKTPNPHEKGKIL
jgi:mannose-6-phosphate isomerase-like protein (cupin superfamily)